MKREIKFRQARIIEGKIVWHNWGFIDGIFISPITPDIVHDKEILFKSQQYTNLKDKHKVCIYEGDIINNDSEHSSQVIWKEREAMFGITNGKYELGSYIDDGDYEVIGNIYENKDLLKI